MLTNCRATTNFTTLFLYIMLTKSASITILVKPFQYTMGAPCTPTTRLTIVLTYTVRTQQPSPTTLTAITLQIIVLTVRFTVSYTLYNFLYYLSCAHTSGPFCLNTVVVIARKSSLEALFADVDRTNNKFHTSCKQKIYIYIYFLDVT